MTEAKATERREPAPPAVSGPDTAAGMYEKLTVLLAKLERGAISTAAFTNRLLQWVGEARDLPPAERDKLKIFNAELRTAESHERRSVAARARWQRQREDRPSAPIENAAVEMLRTEGAMDLKTLVQKIEARGFVLNGGYDTAKAQTINVILKRRARELADVERAPESHSRRVLWRAAADAPEA